VASGEVSNIADAYEDARFNSDVDKKTGYHTRSILCVPVKNGKEIIGCTQMLNKFGGGPFTRTDVELMSAFNVFCGIALSNAQLYEAASKSKQKMTVMLDLALSLWANVSALSGMLGKVGALVDADSCSLEAVDYSTHSLVRRDEKVDLREDVTGFAVLTGCELNCGNPTKDPRFLKAASAPFVLAVPVYDAPGNIVAVLRATRASLFNEGEI
jgi:hypothetical protein